MARAALTERSNPRLRSTERRVSTSLDIICRVSISWKISSFRHNPGKYSHLISPASSDVRRRERGKEGVSASDLRTSTDLNDVIISADCGRIKYLSAASVVHLSPADDNPARFLRGKTLDRSAGSFRTGRIAVGSGTSQLVPEEHRPRKTVRQLRGFVGFTSRRSHRVCLLVEIRQNARFTGNVNGTPARANRPPRRWFMVWLFG